MGGWLLTIHPFYCVSYPIQYLGPSVGIFFKLNLTIYDGSSVVLRMMSDVFRSSQLLSDVFRVLSIDRRKS